MVKIKQKLYLVKFEVRATNLKRALNAKGRTLYEVVEVEDKKIDPAIPVGFKEPKK